MAVNMRIHNNRVRHPGEHIKERLDRCGWSQRDLAFVLGCPEQGINMLVTGKRGISPEMAKALGSAFGISADEFSNLQYAYDLANARNPDPGVAKRARMQSKYPVREMINRGWLEDTDAETLEAQMARFFEVPHIDDVPHMTPVAKKTKYDGIPPEQLAWLFGIKQIAKSIVIPEYSEKLLAKALLKFKEILFGPKWIREISRILGECGVRFILAEPLAGSKIDGTCFWINNNTSPVIGMSLRHDRIDNFLVVLKHEVRRVLHRHGQDKAIIDVNIFNDTDNLILEEEKIANSVASKLCISTAEMDSLLAQKSPSFADSDIQQFERIMKIHPELVANPIFVTVKKYLFRKYLTKYMRFSLQEVSKEGRDKKFMGFL